MKTKLKIVGHRRLLTCLTLLAVFFIAPLSCKKTQNDQIAEKETLLNQEWDKRKIELIKEDFLSKDFSQEELQTKVEQNDSKYTLSWRIIWNKGVERIDRDSTQYIYVPLKAYYKSKGVRDYQPANMANYERYLLVISTKKEVSYSLAYKFASDIPERSPSKKYNARFAGKMSFTPLSGGKGSALNNRTVGSTKTMVTTSPTTGCYNVYLCSYGVLCNGSGVTVMGVVNYVNCTTPTLSEVQNKLYGCVMNGTPSLNSSSFLRRECAPGYQDTTPPPPIPPTPGGSGGGGGVNTAPGGVSSPAAAADPTKIYAFGGPNGKESDGRLNCKSFKFKSVGDGNSQEAGISGLQFVIFLPNGSIAKQFFFRTMYVNVGIKQKNGQTRTPGQAAVDAAHAANRAGMSLSVKYFGVKTVEQVDLLMTSTIEKEFSDLFQTCMQQEVEGYAAILYKPVKADTPVTPAVWNGPITMLVNWLTGGGGCAD